MLNSEINRVSKKIEAAELSFFCTPHLIVDDVFSIHLLDKINALWPKNGFHEEVTGNYLLPLTKASYEDIQNRKFWREVNEKLWPKLLGEIAKKFERCGMKIFGDLYQNFLFLDHPLTLMEADHRYNGHGMHTHFYHCPHWAFTMLLYIDPHDNQSNGTTLHNLQPSVGSVNYNGACIPSEIQRCASVAFETFDWSDEQYKYLEKTVEYKSNRLFVFMDGPLSLHSVKPHFSECEAPFELSVANSRRRVLRSHVKIHHVPFYSKMSEMLGVEIDPSVYMRCMAMDSSLNEQEKTFKENILRKFYSVSVHSYSKLNPSLKEGRLLQLIKKMTKVGQSKKLYSDKFFETIP